MAKARKATRPLPRDRVSAESVSAGGYHPPVSLGDYDHDGSGLRDPDFESELEEAARVLSGGEPGDRLVPLDEIFPA